MQLPLDAWFGKGVDTCFCRSVSSLFSKRVDTCFKRDMEQHSLRFYDGGPLYIASNMVCKNSVIHRFLCVPWVLFNRVPLNNARSLYTKLPNAGFEELCMSDSPTKHSMA